MRYFQKIAEQEGELGGKGFFNKYIVPSMVAGPLIGSAVHLATKGRGTPFFTKDLAKSVGMAIPADIATGAAIGAWAEHKK